MVVFEVEVSQESQNNSEKSGKDQYGIAISYCCRTEAIPVWAFYSSTKLQFRTTVDETIPFGGTVWRLGVASRGREFRGDLG